MSANWDPCWYNISTALLLSAHQCSKRSHLSWNGPTMTFYFTAAHTTGPALLYIRPHFLRGQCAIELLQLYWAHNIKKTDQNQCNQIYCTYCTLHSYITPNAIRSFNKYSNLIAHIQGLSLSSPMVHKSICSKSAPCGSRCLLKLHLFDTRHQNVCHLFTKMAADITSKTKWPHVHLVWI